MTEFKRGLSDKFVSALGNLAQRGGWWAEVLKDEDLIIGVRDEYLNVYWQGQSLLKVETSGDRIVASSHPKYLLNPDLSRPIPFDAYEGTFAEFPIAGLARVWELGKTLGRLKRAARPYAGKEKWGVHYIAHRSENLIDVEIAVTTDELGCRCAPRLDIAVFEPDASGVKLVFWEAKTFKNPELRAKGEKSVLRQIARYRSLLSQPGLQSNMLDSYRAVARNLVALSAMSEGKRRVGSLIQRVADNERIIIDDPPSLNLVVYGFDADQRDATWRRLKGELSGGTGRIVAAGNPSKINLASSGGK